MIYLVSFIILASFVSNVCKVFGSRKEKELKRKTAQLDFVKKQLEVLNLADKREDFDFSDVDLNDRNVSLASSAPRFSSIVFGIGLGFCSFAVFLFVFCYIIG